MTAISSEIEVPFNGIIEMSNYNGKSNFDRLYSTYPLKLIPLPSSSNSALSTLYLIGHGGGLVAGDKIKINITLSDSCVLVLKTQGSTKVFKRASTRINEPVLQIIHACMRGDSFLLSLPDPTTCFKDSHLNQSQVFNLSNNASCAIVDTFTCGRKSLGEMWDASRIQSRMQVFREGKLLLVENTDLESSAFGSMSDKIRGCVFGTIVLVGPRTASLRARLQQLKQRQSFQAHKSALKQQETIVEFQDPLVSVSEFPCKSGAIVRFSAQTVEDAYCLLASVFLPLAAEIHLSPSPYTDRINSASLASRVAQEGSIFHTLRHYHGVEALGSDPIGSKRRRED